MTSNFEVVGWAILELGKAISKYLHKCRPKEFGDERKGEGEKTVIFFYFVSFFFFGSSTRWKKFPFRFYTEIILEVLYRFRKTMGRVGGELGKEFNSSSFLVENAKLKQIHNEKMKKKKNQWNNEFCLNFYFEICFNLPSS